METLTKDGGERHLSKNKRVRVMTNKKCGENDVPIQRLEVSAYTIPTDAPESDGTYTWDKTTMVLVEASAGGHTGIGCTYADTATATLIKEMFAEVVRGRNAMDVPGCWLAMVEAMPSSY